MSRYHFEDPAAVTALLQANEELRDTPFMKFSFAPGPRGGIDCVGAVQFLQTRAGAADEGEFSFPREFSDYASASTARKVMRYLMGLHLDPQSKRLAQRYARVPIFRHIRRRGRNIDPSIFMPGDILICRQGGLFHLPVMLIGRQFVSALPGFGVREGNIHDTSYSPFFAALFRARSDAGRAEFITNQNAEATR